MSSRENDIPGLGRRTDPVRVARGAEAARARLSSEEGSVLSLLARELPLGELIARLGLPEPRAVALVVALRGKGVIELGTAAAAPGRYTGFVFDLLELNEENVDLDLERRKEILFLHARLRQLSHYDLLGVRPKDPPQRLKEAYFELAKRFHPDRFVARRLGRFQPRIEKIFKAIGEAERVLSDPGTKRQYDATVKVALTPEEEATARLREAEQGILDARAAERRERMKKRSPLLKRLNTAGDFARRGHEAFDKGQWSRAAVDLSTAASLDPKNAELARLAGEAKKKADLERAEELLSKAEMAHHSGYLGEALENLRAAAGLAPRSGKILKVVVGSFLEFGRDPGEARELAQQLAELLPSDAEAHALHGRALIGNGQEKAGKQALERALELDPHQPYARSVLKKFWPF